MGKYRIVRWETSEPERYGGEQFWHKVEPHQAEDLDLQEIANLNKLPDDPPPEAAEEEELTPVSIFRSWLMPVLAVIVALAMCAWIIGDFINTGSGPDFSFLSQSADLAQDEALTSLRSAVVSIDGAKATGTGFNISAEGLIVTNRHVVEDNLAVSVLFAEGKRYQVREWQYIGDYDLAVGRLSSARDLPHVNLVAELPEVGAHLIFIGNPLGFDWTISEGELIEVYSNGEDSIISFSGPVRPGNSGSPLFNSEGDVIGVIYASRTDEKDSGLAIPASVLLSYLE